MEMKELARIKTLTRGAFNLENFFSNYYAKMEQDRCDKHGWSFNGDDRFSAFGKVTIWFESHYGYYGNLSCYRSGPEISNKDAQEYLPRALNQHAELIFNTMAKLMREDASGKREKAEAEIKYAQDLLDHVSENAS